MKPTFWISLVALLASACSGGNPATELAIGKEWRIVGGTAEDDLWLFTNDPRTCQFCVPTTHLAYFDGEKQTTVPMPALFQDAGDGLPHTFCATKRGELWMAGAEATKAGGPGAVIGTRQLVGVVQRDGTFRDLTGTFPVSPQGTYRDAQLACRGGAVFLLTRIGDNPAHLRLHRLDGAAPQELPAPPSPGGKWLFAFSPNDMAYDGQHFDGTQWTADTSDQSFAGTELVSSGGGDTWVWSTLTSNAMRACRRANGTYQCQNVVVEEPETRGFVVRALIPRGGGRFTLLGSVEDGGVRLAVRQFDGTNLGDTDEDVTSAAICQTGQIAPECAFYEMRIWSVLENGTILARPANTIGAPEPVPTWFFIRPDDLPQ